MAPWCRDAEHWRQAARHTSGRRTSAALLRRGKPDPRSGWGEEREGELRRGRREEE
jgi:hypothetical protein